MSVSNVKKEGVRVFWWLLLLSLLSDSPCLGQSTVHWELTAYGRRAALADPGQEQPGFEEMNPDSTGLSFVNPLEQSYNDLNQNLVGSGVALGDVNGDDLCDLFFASLNGTCRLFLNRGGWTFEDQTVQGGLVIKNQLATGVLLEDLDADGDLDLVVAFNGSGLRWWENNGRGQFGEMTPENFRSRTGPTSLAVADVDQNGLLDLYVANYGENTIRSGASVRTRMVRGKQVVTGRWRDRIEIIDGQLVEFGEPDHLWLQPSKGSFVQLSWTEGRFLDTSGRPLNRAPHDLSLSVMIRDLNQDQLPDIFECNDFQSPDRIWINQGGGVFRAIEHGAIRSMCHFSMGFDAADINRDGWDDLYAVDMLSRIHRIRMIQKIEMNPNPSHLPEEDLHAMQLRRNTLLLSRGDGTFAETARQAGLEATDWSWCPIFLDVDLDGWEDLLVVNGHLMDALDSDVMERRQRLPDGSPEKKQVRYPPLMTPNVAFRNGGDLNFTSVGEQWGFDSQRISNGFCMGDLDFDGDMDLVINCLNDQALVYRNRCSAPRIAVRLVWKPGNSSAIGARVALVGQETTLHQEMIGGGRYLSDDQNVRSFAMIFEPGQCHLRITWPDGTTSRVDEVEAGWLYEIDVSKVASLPKESSERPATKPLFAPHGPLIELPASGDSMADWDWQPSVNRPLRRQGAVASVRQDPDEKRDILALPNRPLGSPVSQKGSLQAWAWINAQRKPELTLLGFSEDPKKTLPKGPIQSAAPWAEADINQDGHRDVFVGMPPLPGPYPLGTGSRLYLGGENPTIEEGDPWSNIGNVRAVLMEDFNQDGWVDLAIAAEWAPIRVFINHQGALHEATQAWGLSSHVGWWQTLVAVDVEKDGDIDLIAGNWGRNTRYQSLMQGEEGLRLYTADGNQDGILETIEAWFDESNGHWWPIDGLGHQEKVFLGLRAHYPTHHALAGVPMRVLAETLDLDKAFLHVNTLDSMVFLNQGGRFQSLPLPEVAQRSPVRDMVGADFNLDGYGDLFVAQNWESTPDHIGRLDAGQGLILQGKPDGSFEPLSAEASGIRIDAEQQSAWVGDANGDQRPDLWIQHSGMIQLYLNQHEL